MKRLFSGAINKHIGNGKTVHKWTLSCGKAAIALKEMLPYLINKKEVAKLGIRFQRGVRRGSRVCQSTYQRRERLRERIKELNKRD